MTEVATALIIDTETDQGRDPRPIQVATINVATGFEWMKYFNSGRTISPIVIGHNVRFDWRVIGRPTAKLICTVSLARVAFPEWRYYGQSKCIEQLIGKEEARQMTVAAHDALGDARMCYLLYQACCVRLQIAPTDFAAAHTISNTANPVGKMPFGKHKGELIKDVPISYVKWMLGNIHNMQPSLYSALTKRVEAEKLASEKTKAL